MTSTFGPKIKKLRVEKSLTLDQLAQMTESSKSYIWELENKNPPRPSAEKLAAIAAALSVTVDYLLGTQGASRELAEDTAFFREYSGLPDSTKKQLREIARTLGAKPAK